MGKMNLLDARMAVQADPRKIRIEIEHRRTLDSLADPRTEIDA